MAVERLERALGGADLPGHSQPITTPCSRIALLERLRRRRDVLAQQIAVGLKAAVGKQDRAPDVAAARAVRLRLDSDTARPVHDQRQRLGAAVNLTSALEQILFQPPQRHIRSYSLPFHVRDGRPARREYVLPPRNRTFRIEFGAFLGEPLHRPARGTRQSRHQRVIRAAIRYFLDRAHEFRRRIHHIVIGDMQHAAGVTRVARVRLVLSALQHHGLESKLRGTVGGDESRKSTTDDDQIE